MTDGFCPCSTALNRAPYRRSSDGPPSSVPALVAEEAGLLPEESPPHGAGAGTRRLCIPGPAAVWRLLPLAQLVFEVDTDLPETSYAFVTGRLDEGLGTWEAVRAMFPAGTMTGAPKVRAMEIIDGLMAEAADMYGQIVVGPPR
ncbi:chorismate-binding protein [Streptomyces sp. NPDC058457]|uniref:chorismate-binding protein n=1 Tax=Streptomyces sp. NPDC058457 TaxID=3346507 RepID=UPI00365B32DE